MPNDAREKLEQECRELAQSCLYSSTMLYIWARRKRLVRLLFIVLPIVLAGIGSWSILTALDSFWAKMVTSGLTLLAGLLPSIYAALKYDDDLKEAVAAAGQFTVLKNRFRQAPILNADKPLADLEAEFRKIREDHEKAQQMGVTPPEWAFRKAQEKIKAGHYDPDPERYEGSAPPLAVASAQSPANELPPQSPA